MACQHKFSDYLELGLLDFEPTTLVIGTFNPEWPAGNYAEWFYGRTGNNYFWDVLPRLYNPDLNLRNENAKSWKAFCSEKKIAITDLITCIMDADQDNSSHQKLLGNYQDSAIAKSFNNFETTKIVDILKKWPSIRHVYLTRQNGNPFYDKLWAPIKEYCNNKGLEAHCLLTPSAGARFKVRAYKEENPNDPTPLRNFIYQAWKNQWHNKP